MKINYVHTADIHNTIAAKSFIPILFKEIGLPESVVDIGCGIGTWLSVFKESGVKKILGIDGEYVDSKVLFIAESEFLKADLEKPFRYSEKFDLAVCLEVAEHLTIDASGVLVDTLCNLADRILFSAALPNQGGQNHINEQPFEYWKKEFNVRGYVWKDVFREKIWMNQDINWWYRQNMFLVEKIDQNPIQQDFINDFYHPELYINNTSFLYNERNILLTEINLLQQSNGKIFMGEISPGVSFKIFIKSVLFLLKTKLGVLKKT